MPYSKCLYFSLKERASAGNRTRIDCLEGNHANLYTTDAMLKLLPNMVKTEIEISIVGHVH